MIAGSYKKMAAEEKIGHGKTSTKNNPCSMKNQNSWLKNAFLWFPSFLFVDTPPQLNPVFDSIIASIFKPCNLLFIC